MRKVERLECPKILNKEEAPDSEGVLETKDAITFFSEEENHNEKFQKTGKTGKRIKKSFSVYSNDEVRSQLMKMFHGKCAYCESPITAIYNGDIEHFRPKGGYNDVSGKLVKPGYFWLASEWENLLLACPHCNQTNTHVISENGINTKEIVLGKHNQFPLLKEKNRLKYNHGKIYFIDSNKYKEAFDKEENDRLLLKPCLDNVDAYFEYNDVGVIKASSTITGMEKLRAETSIDVYALQRIGLNRAREEKVIEIKAQIKRVEKIIDKINKSENLSDANKADLKEELRDEMIILRKFMNPDKPYSGMAIFIINKYFSDFSKL